MGAISRTYRRVTGKTVPRVVIAGAGFAGLETAMNLDADYDVCVIDPKPHFEFLPNIHELVGLMKRPHELRFSRDRLLRQQGHHFFQDTVREINPETSCVRTSSGNLFYFDACVISIGGKDSVFGILNAREYSMPFKSVQNGHAIALQLRRLLAEKSSVSVVIVGGGLEGIEVLGEILRVYRNHPELALHIVECSAQLAPGMLPAIDRDIREICRPFAVNFHTGDCVAAMEKTQIRLKSGALIARDLIVWTGGLEPDPLLHASGLTDSPAEWALVDETLRSARHERIFVIGDACRLSKPLGKQAYHAMDMGRTAAENIRRMLGGGKVRPYRSSTKPTLISFGDLMTYMVLEEKVYAGRSLAALKEGVYQYVMAHYDPSRRLGFMWNASRRALAGVSFFGRSMLPSTLEDIGRIPQVRSL